MAAQSNLRPQTSTSCLVYRVERLLACLWFSNSRSDASLFVYNVGGNIIYFLVYVDDLLITGNNTTQINEFSTALSHRFSLKDLRPLIYFLGVEVISTSQGLFLSQHQYIHDLLTRTKMDGTKIALTPMTTSESLTLNDGSSSTNAQEYGRIVGSLQYLSLTRPDISFSVNKLA